MGFDSKIKEKEVISMRIAVPSMLPGGLKSQSSGHFGHCDVFTLVDIENGSIEDTKVIANAPHVQGGCMTPVNLLGEHGVQAILVGGIGMRPLIGFKQVGIDVYAGATGTVEFAVNEFINGNLQLAGEKDVCGHSRGG
jgi:predicted Fe-Mo cluster-binding NifX family protein